MSPGSFTEADQEKAIELLNFVAKNAVFKELETNQVIEYFKLLSWAQQELVPKLKANVLEVKAVREQKPEPKKTRRRIKSKES